MRASTLTICFALLCMGAAPGAAEPARPAPAAHQQAAPARRSATPDELERYAQRERSAKTQAKFQGGRGYYFEASTVIIILLVVILVIILI